MQPDESSLDQEISAPSPSSPRRRTKGKLNIFPAVKYFA